MALQLTGAAHDGVDRQPADPPADRRDRRRAHGDRHRHRVPRLLPGAGGEIPVALRDPRRGAKRGRGAERAGTRKRRRSPRSSWRMRSRHPRGARARRARSARRRASSSCCSRGAESPSPTASASIDSPSYTLNHEEVEKALEEGIRFAESLTPVARRGGRDGHARARWCEGAPRRCGGCRERARGRAARSHAS